jgi:hypothetical protein
LRLILLALLVSCFHLSGCGYKVIKNNGSDFILHSSARRDELIKKYSSPSSTWQQQYDKASGESKKQARNDILNDLMWLADDYYGQLTSELRNNNAWRQTLFDAAKLGLGAAGSVVGDAELKAILAATGTAVQGLNTSIDKNFYAQQSVEAIVAAMDSQRAEDKKLVVAGMAQFADQTPTYPLSQGLLDVQKYALDTTLTHALIALSQKAAAAAVKSTAELTTMQIAQYEFRAQDLERTHQAVDEVLKDSSAYSIDSLRHIPDANMRQQIASQRFALLNVALGQIDSLLSKPLLPSETREYFTDIQRRLRNEKHALAANFAVQ